MIRGTLGNFDNAILVEDMNQASIPFLREEEEVVDVNYIFGWLD